MTIVNEVWRILRSVVIIFFFFFTELFCKTTFDICNTRGNKDERTLNILKSLNFYQKLKVTVRPNHEDRWEGSNEDNEQEKS